MLGAREFLLFFTLGFTAANFQLNIENISSISSTSGLTIARFLQDGEFQRVITWPGFCVKETTVDWGQIDVTLREVWLEEEKLKLQLIYEGGILSDCFEEKIKTKIKDEEECLSILNIKLKEHTKENGQDDENTLDFQLLSSPTIDFPSSSNNYDLHDWFTSTDVLRHECFRVRTKTRNQVLARQQGQSCCRRHDHCHRAIPPMTRRYSFYNHMPFTLSHCGCDQRKFNNDRKSKTSKTVKNSKRGRRRGRGKRDLLLIPGTQWCGRGHRATKYTNLGGFGIADACCRRHDTTCPFFIPAFQTKYNLFNWGVSTLMHCACDERFRTCLKMADTSSANFVGKLFFNIVQTKCFVLKPQKTCLQRSWWGKCEIHDYRKQAYLRDNVPY